MYYISYAITNRNKLIIESFTNENKALLWLRRLKDDGNIKDSEVREFETQKEADAYMYEMSL